MRGQGAFCRDPDLIAPLLMFAAAKPMMGGTVRLTLPLCAALVLLLGATPSGSSGAHRGIDRAAYILQNAKILASLPKPAGSRMVLQSSIPQYPGTDTGKPKGYATIRHYRVPQHWQDAAKVVRFYRSRLQSTWVLWVRTSCTLAYRHRAASLVLFTCHPRLRHGFSLKVDFRGYG